MKSCRSKWMLIVSTLILVEGFCAENDTESNSSESSSEFPTSNNDSGTSIAETIAEIANDPGGGFGGGR